MTVYELIQALAEFPADLEVKGGVWPKGNRSTKFNLFARGVHRLRSERLARVEQYDYVAVSFEREEKP